MLARLKQVADKRDNLILEELARAGELQPAAEWGALHIEFQTRPSDPPGFLWSVEIGGGYVYISSIYTHRCFHADQYRN